MTQEQHPEYRDLNDFSKVVFEKLRSVTEDQLQEALEKAKLDPGVGLAVSPLDIEPMNFESYDYYSSAGKIVSEKSDGTRPCITPHYHKFACDFVIFKRDTEVTLGKLSPDGKGVLWDDMRVAQAGEEFRLDPNIVHTWRAIKGGESDFVFCCPNEHLQDNSTDNPKGDRYIVKDLENGTPSNYLEN